MRNERPRVGIEEKFDVSFMARLTAEEKQIQQNYRPVIGVHKWFARRPGSLFRGLLLAEFDSEGPLSSEYFRPHELLELTIGDPFMGGGTTLFEASRVGCNVIGFDINPMAYWVVRQELVGIDRVSFRHEAEAVVRDVEKRVADLYRTTCVECGADAPVKYFLWVKDQPCGACGEGVDLFPGYLVATNDRHTHFVLYCPECRKLVQVEALPAKGERVRCPGCSSCFDWREGTASRNRYRCRCGHEGRYPSELRESGPPSHRLFGIEYSCSNCETHKGRWFKTADQSDLARYERATESLRKAKGLPCPQEEIPDGDETKRLHRWGYRTYREMFNERQLLSLGLLVERIRAVEGPEERRALATVFSDFLRYQNMLCRYDTYALKCQDIFSVHGFPVGLIQCENNVLGIHGVGSGAFRHFVEKYDRAKAYCEAPFETVRNGGSKKLVQVAGERIAAQLVTTPARARGGRRALLKAASAEDVELPARSLDAVFTDPPYFDNVQYAELMDFCYAWLRLFLEGEVAEFRNGSTRSMKELTGNATLGRDVEHFTEGLSRVFSQMAKALKPGGPFVFTYHHNDLEAYVPVGVAVLDAGLNCTATLPSPAEMTASLHINGTGSSVVDTVLVCRKGRKQPRERMGRATLLKLLARDGALLAEGGVKVTRGDLYCLSLGHLTRVCVGTLRSAWRSNRATREKMGIFERELCSCVEKCDVDAVVQEVLASPAPLRGLAKSAQAGLFD